MNFLRSAAGMVFSREDPKIIPIFKAIDENDLATVQRIIEEEGVSIESKNSKGDTLLMYSVRFGKHDISLWLLEKGANPNIPYNKKDKLSLLTLAAGWGYMPLMRALDEHGILYYDPNVSDENKIYNDHVYYALTYAAYYGRNDVVEFLLGAGIPPNLYIDNKSKSDPLFITLHMIPILFSQWNNGVNNEGKDINLSNADVLYGIKINTTTGTYNDYINIFKLLYEDSLELEDYIMIPGLLSAAINTSDEELVEDVLRLGYRPTEEDADEARATLSHDMNLVRRLFRYVAMNNGNINANNNNAFNNGNILNNGSNIKAINIMDAPHRGTLLVSPDNKTNSISHDEFEDGSEVVVVLNKVSQVNQNTYRLLSNNYAYFIYSLQAWFDNLIEMKKPLKNPSTNEPINDIEDIARYTVKIEETAPVFLGKRARRNYNNNSSNNRNTKRAAVGGRRQRKRTTHKKKVRRTLRKKQAAKRY